MENLSFDELTNLNGGGAIFAFSGAILGCTVGAVIGGGKAVYDVATGHDSEAKDDAFATMKGCASVGGIAGAMFPEP